MRRLQSEMAKRRPGKHDSAYTTQQSALTVNSDLIKFVEQSPDTLITLVTGEKIVVRESLKDILARHH